MPSLNHQSISSRAGKSLPVHSPLLIPNDWDFHTVVIEQAGVLDGDATAYKVYDEALARWLQQRYTADNGRSLPVVPSAPQNAFANYRKMLIALGVIKDCEDNLRDYSNLPLPMISLHRTGEDYREGGVGQFPIRSIGTVDDSGNRWTGFTRYPKPMWFEYTVSLWAQHKQHLAWLKHQLELTFWNKVAWTLVQHSKLGKPKYCAIHRESAEDLSNWSRQDTEDLILRTAYKVRVEAWLWDDILGAPKALAATITDADTGETTFHEAFSPDWAGPLPEGSAAPPFLLPEVSSSSSHSSASSPSSASSSSSSSSSPVLSSDSSQSSASSLSSLSSPSSSSSQSDDSSSESSQVLLYGPLSVLFLGDADSETYAGVIYDALTAQNVDETTTVDFRVLGTDYDGDEDLSGYDVIVVSTNGGQSGGTGLAANLTSFVSAGGGLVNMTFLWNIAPVGFDRLGLTGFGGSGQDFAGPSMTELMPHPITDGLNPNVYGTSSWVNSVPAASALESGWDEIATMGPYKFLWVSEALAGRRVSLNGFAGALSTGIFSQYAARAIMWAGQLIPPVPFLMANGDLVLNYVPGVNGVYTLVSHVDESEYEAYLVHGFGAPEEQDQPWIVLLSTSEDGGYGYSFGQIGGGDDFANPITDPSDIGAGAGNAIHPAMRSYCGATKVMLATNALTQTDPEAWSAYELVQDDDWATGAYSVYDALLNGRTLFGASNYANNDSSFGNPSTFNPTASYSGQHYAGSLALSRSGTGNLPQTLGYFFVTGINREGDNDVSALAFCNNTGLPGNNWGDQWRSLSQLGTKWSYWNDDFHTSSVSQRIGGSGQALAGLRSEYGFDNSWNAWVLVR